MKILGIDTSSNPASCAVSEDGNVLAEFYLNTKKTHSQTILGMIDQVKKVLELDMDSIDVIAVSKGPGSFTGLRIGSATAKGLALALQKPIAEISTLEMMAFQMYGTDHVICPILDARRSEVYTGVYCFEDEELKCISKDKPIAIVDLLEELDSIGRPVIFLGDAVPVHKDTILEKTNVPVRFALGYQNRQRASALCILAERYVENDKLIDGDMHRPEYLRVSQAERERAEAVKRAKEQ